MMKSKVTKLKSGKASSPERSMSWEEFDKKNPGAREEVAAFNAWAETGKVPKGRRVFSLPNPPEPKEIRKIRLDLNLSQSQMAGILQTPKKTYQNWEQGLRVPMGAVALLLRLLKKRPAIIKDLMAI